VKIERFYELYMEYKKLASTMLTRI